MSAPREAFLKVHWTLFPAVSFMALFLVLYFFSFCCWFFTTRLCACWGQGTCLPRLVSWIWSVYSHTGSRTRKGPMLGLMSCCYHLEVWKRVPCFPFALGPANYVASPAVYLVHCRISGAQNSGWHKIGVEMFVEYFSKASGSLLFHLLNLSDS